MLPLSPFRRAAAEAVGAALGVDPASFAVSTPPAGMAGDYAVGCFPAAKALRAAPPALAQKVVAAFRPTALLAGATAAGPYVNFTIDRGALYRHLFTRARAIPNTVGAGKTVCVDFSSPNIAKPLAYHHIRSTVIGHALVEIHAALGYDAQGINHLGDWGTTFGMILAAHHKWGAPEPLTIEGLNDLYVRFRNAIKEDPSLENEGRAWFKRLEDGDALARQLWQRYREISLAEYQEAYDLLGITFHSIRGESDYEAAMPGVIELLAKQGLTSVHDDGHGEALIVDLAADGIDTPLMLRKSDGASTYHTRDLATAIYRWDTYRFERSLYVVDRGQSLHFKQLFATLKKAGFPWADRLQHVSFGLVKMGGKKTGTRSGNVVGLKEVLGEAQARIAAVVAEKNPELPPAKRAEVARDVGIGAVVFFNLSSQREKDIEFEMDRVLSFDGDAGPYVQMAHARTASVLRKSGALAGQLAGADPAKLVRDEEWAVAKLLCDIGDETARAAEGSEPHIVAHYLLDVCAAYSRWFTAGNQDASLKVLGVDAPTSQARLALTAATKDTLREGLALLGMKAPDEM